MSGPIPLERGAQLELDALLGKLEELAAEGDRTRYDSDERYCWVIHRRWIAVGNETTRLEAAVVAVEPSDGLRKLRNELAHVRLPDMNRQSMAADCHASAGTTPAAPRHEALNIVR